MSSDYARTNESSTSEGSSSTGAEKFNRRCSLQALESVAERAQMSDLKDVAMIMSDIHATWPRLAPFIIEALRKRIGSLDLAHTSLIEGDWIYYSYDYRYQGRQSARFHLLASLLPQQ